MPREISRDHLLKVRDGVVALIKAGGEAKHYVALLEQQLFVAIHL